MSSDIRNAEKGAYEPAPIEREATRNSEGGGSQVTHRPQGEVRQVDIDRDLAGHKG